MGAKNSSVENDFFTWLSTRVSPVQLSNLYTAYTDINNYCIHRKILRQHLFETIDEVAVLTIKKIIDYDREFSFIYRKQRNLMSQAINYYLQYIRERHLNVEVTVDEKAPLSTSRLVTTDSDYDALKKLLQKEGITFIDNRIKNGCLWILDGTGLKEFVKQCKSMGVILKCADKSEWF